VAFRPMIYYLRSCSVNGSKYLNGHEKINDK
jgi:hypothetical protein